jgi:hypothetical protein
MATPEKALFDAAYHAAQRGWRSAFFPEIELPEGFDPAFVDAWIARIPSAKLRTMTQIVSTDMGVPGQEHGRMTPGRAAARASARALGSTRRANEPAAANPTRQPRQTL